ncbi:unnamed protein product [Adineta steineri]|uniref:alpha-L-rhamnosidase n=2 Tax=Adineta steineri TaxID=433720 RepID=A0A814KZA6_9BILA|nr:unnamed protein product [Adineta steineri]
MISYHFNGLSVDFTAKIIVHLSNNNNENNKYGNIYHLINKNCEIRCEEIIDGMKKCGIEIEGISDNEWKMKIKTIENGELFIENLSGERNGESNEKMNTDVCGLECPSLDKEYIIKWLGHHDLALKLAQSISYPSYGYMFHNDIQNAATTWELWNTLPQGATALLNHHMFNSIGAWFYRYLAGIELNGLQTITIYPRMSYDADLLNYVKAEVVTIKGSIRVEWSRTTVNTVNLSIVIPNNMDAIVTFDSLIKNGQCVKLMCDDETIWMRGEMNDEIKLSRDINGVNDLSENKLQGTMSMRVASGEYTFVAYWK